MKRAPAFFRLFFFYTQTEKLIHYFNEAANDKSFLRSRSLNNGKFIQKISQFFFRHSVWFSITFYCEPASQTIQLHDWQLDGNHCNNFILICARRTNFPSPGHPATRPPNLPHQYFPAWSCCCGWRFWLFCCGNKTEGILKWRRNGLGPTTTTGTFNFDEEERIRYRFHGDWNKNCWFRVFFFYSDP